MEACWRMLSAHELFELDRAIKAAKHDHLDDQDPTVFVRLSIVEKLLANANQAELAELRRNYEGKTIDLRSQRVGRE
jgi:hypothetical protein